MTEEHTLERTYLNMEIIKGFTHTHTHTLFEMICCTDGREVLRYFRGTK